MLANVDFKSGLLLGLSGVVVSSSLSTMRRPRLVPLPVLGGEVGAVLSRSSKGSFSNVSKKKF